jgi:sphingomyelin phosphodiesterase acid-like 3
VPPGINAFTSARASAPYYGDIESFWLPVYNEQFQGLVETYGELLRYAFAGHNHADDFRLNYASGSPALLSRIVPSVSPVFGNNPAFVKYTYSPATGEIGDYLVCRADVPEEKSSAFDPSWKPEYSFAATYNQPAFTPASFNALAKRLLEEPAVRQKYMKYNKVSSTKYPLKEDQWYFYCCSLGNSAEENYIKCLFSQALK